MKLKRIRILIFLIVTVILLLNGCDNKGSAETPMSREAFKLNTIITITIYDSRDKSLLDGAMAVCDKYEEQYSRTLKTSELYKLNHGLLKKAGNTDNGYLVSSELSDLLRYGLYYSKLSQGAFDITIEPVSSLWDFTSGDAVIPDTKDIKNAVKSIDYRSIAQNQNTITFSKDHMGIDLGAIAKGYIADRIKDYLIQKGVKSAIINLGGNVLVIGKKPDGEPFKIGIQKPFADRNEVAASMDIEDLSVVSSGVYERYFKKDGILYHHILNPSTGYPYDNGLISVTIISPKSVDGDGLSTSCFALGLDKGMGLINQIENTYAVFITKDYKLHYSEGFKEHIKVTEVK